MNKTIFKLSISVSSFFYAFTFDQPMRTFVIVVSSSFASHYIIKLRKNKNGGEWNEKKRISEER